MSETLTLPGTSTSGEVPLERLEAQICELAGHLTAATCRWLVLVGDFDARRGWESWDLPSCSAWLSWKCQLSPGTAREHVRVARSLRDLPAIRGQFAAGRLSYAKVRALTRIAAPATEADLAELAGPMTGAQLDRFARAHRRVSRADDDAARVARRVTWRVDDQDGSVAMTVRLPAAQGQVLIQALRAAASDLDHPHRSHDGHDDRAAAPSAGTRPTAVPTRPGPGRAPAEAPVPSPGDDTSAAAPASPDDGRASAEAPTPPGPTAEEEARPGAQSLADALTGIAADYLAGKIATAANPDIYQVIVHVGPEALTTTGDDTDNDPAPAPRAPAEASATATLPATGPLPATSSPAKPPTRAPAEAPAPAQPPATGEPSASAGSLAAASPAQAISAPAEAPAVDPAAADPTGGKAEEPGADAEDDCRPDCPYRRVGHPANSRRCHFEDGPALSYAAAQRIACTATVSWMLHDHDGTLLDIGRRHRKPTAAQRRAVRERDKYRCAFPGCQSRRTDLHHIRHWAKGGTTSYWNLVCLCEAHHVIVHETGYLITRNEGGGFTFTRPDGTIMPASPQLPAPETGDITTRHEAPITPDTIQAAAGERMNLHLTIWAAFANARLSRKRAAG